MDHTEGGSSPSQFRRYREAGRWDPDADVAEEYSGAGSTVDEVCARYDDRSDAVVRPSHRDRSEFR
jgi:hypothetical protein